MMKKSLIVAALLLAGTSAVAQNYFVGVDYIHAKTTATVSSIVNGASIGSETTSDTDNNINLKIGLDNIAHGRIYIQTGKLDEDTESDRQLKYKSTSLNYDYYIGTYGKFTPYIGAGIGQGKLSWEANVNGTVISASGNGTEYGVKLGSLVKITDNANFEFGYKYGKSNADATWTLGANSVTIEADKVNAVYFGFNYKF